MGSPMPKYTFRPLHKGVTFGHGEGRALRARTGDVIELTEDEAARLNADLPGPSPDVPCLTPVKPAAAKPKPPKAEG